MDLERLPRRNGMTLTKMVTVIVVVVIHVNVPAQAARNNNNNNNYYYYYYSTGVYNPLADFSLLSLEVARSHTLSHHIR
jgi:hypothetical protein